MLEVGGAELAAEHATPRDVDALQRLNDRIARTGGPAAMLAADWKFHHHIHQMSRNELLVLLLDQVAELGKGVRRAGIARDEIRIRSAEQHVAIIEAIASGEPAAAGAAMRTPPRLRAARAAGARGGSGGASGGDEPHGQAPGLA